MWMNKYSHGIGTIRVTSPIETQKYLCYAIDVGHNLFMLWRHTFRRQSPIQIEYELSDFLCMCCLPLYENSISRHKRTGAVTPRWRRQMETFSALLAFCAGNSPVPGEFPARRPVTRSFDVFFDLRLNKKLGKQSWGWWSETPSSSLWRHRNPVAIW